MSSASGLPRSSFSRIASFLIAGRADAPDDYTAHPETGPDALSHDIKLPPEGLKNVPIPPSTAAVDASQIRYWVDIMQQQKMLTKALDPASVIAP